MKYFLLIFFFIACQTNSQTIDLSKTQWAEDIDYFYEQLQKKHANLFSFTPKTLFDSEVTALKQTLEQKTNEEIMVGLIRIAALAKDGHTDLTPLSKIFPIRLGYFQNEIYVTSSLKEHEEFLGGKLLYVEGLSIQKIKSLLEPLVDGDNEMERPRKIPSFLIMSEVLKGLKICKDQKVTYSILTESGIEKKLQLSVINTTTPPNLIHIRTKYASPTPLYLSRTDKNYWYTYIEDKSVLYLQYNACNDQKGEASIKKFAEDFFSFADNLSFKYFILDLRHNTGGNFQKSIPLIEGIKSRNELSKKGTFYIFTSRNTGSAATVTAANLKTHTAVTIIGELSRTNPNYTYNSERFTLPHSKLSVGYTQSLHKPFPQLGDKLAVDIPINLSFEDFKKGIDICMHHITGPVNK